MDENAWWRERKRLKSKPERLGSEVNRGSKEGGGGVEVKEARETKEEAVEPDEVASGKGLNRHPPSHSQSQEHE